jgi:hypothetical protein
MNGPTARTVLDAMHEFIAGEVGHDFGVPMREQARASLQAIGIDNADIPVDHLRALVQNAPDFGGTQGPAVHLNRGDLVGVCGQVSPITSRPELVTCGECLRDEELGEQFAADWFQSEEAQ